MSEVNGPRNYARTYVRKSAPEAKEQREISRVSPELPGTAKNQHHVPLYEFLPQNGPSYGEVIY